MSQLEETVCQKIRQPSEVGLKKYGVSMADEVLSRYEWLVHAQQEAMDLAIYLEKLIQMELMEMMKDGD